MTLQAFHTIHVNVQSQLINSLMRGMKNDLPMHFVFSFFTFTPIKRDATAEFHKSHLSHILPESP